ncbi:MAG: thioredoxin [Lachnospiraceae bacterium]|nr:thioredoxin [Lachnospiraceae bacterium]
MAILHVNESTFKETTAQGTVLLDFYADWCFPCKSMGPVLEKLAASKPDLVIGKINTDENQALAMQFRIMSIPAFILLKDGVEVKRRVGTAPLKEILDWVSE